jgi:type I restriction enzyme S subunit
VKLYAKGVVLRSVTRGDKIGTKILYKVEEGDFVFSKIDLRNGAWGFVPLELAGALVSGDFPIIRIDQTAVWQDYLTYYLSQPYTWEPFRAVSVGTTGRRRARPDAVMTLPIPLPPLPEQRAIAHVLRTVQWAKEATEGVIAALKELKKSLMQHLFTYGPVPVTERERVPLQETEIGPIPAHWRVVKLGEVFDILQGKSLSAKQNKGVRPRPFLRTSNVYWGYLDLSKLDVMDFTEEEEQKFALQHGDLLVCEGGDVGRTAMWEGQMQGVYYQNHLHRLRARDNNVNPAFVMYWLQTAFTLLNLYSGSSNKTTIPNLSRGRLAVFPIPFPPLDEQREIARMLQAVDAKIAAEQAHRAALEELFKTLLHALMSGRIRVPNIVGGQRSRDSAPNADPLPESED